MYIKLIELLTALSLLLSQQLALQSPKLGGMSPSISTAETTLISSVKSIQDAEMLQTGKYKYIPKTNIDAKSYYTVDELQFADGSKGYQTNFYEYKDIQVFNATTSKMEIQSILTHKIIK